MTRLQAIPFSGEWNEDPVDFLRWFLQCMGAADDKTKACHFIYYLKSDSYADEWFEDLGEDEKGSWAVIEVLFRKRWLKEEISIKETVTVKCKPHSPPITSHLVNRAETALQLTPTTKN